MTTLWPITKDAQEALENGEHVRLTHPGGGGDIVLAFEQHVDIPHTVAEWEPEDGWKLDA